MANAPEFTFGEPKEPFLFRARESIDGVRVTDGQVKRTLKKRQIRRQKIGFHRPVQLGLRNASIEPGREFAKTRAPDGAARSPCQTASPEQTGKDGLADPTTSFEAARSSELLDQASDLLDALGRFLGD